MPVCPVCASGGSTLLLSRADTPVLQNVLHASAEAAQAAPRGRLEMRRCDDCGFIWNAGFDPALVDYSVSYENCQSHSPAFAAHLDSRLDRIRVLLAGDGRRSVVEIGCGQGDFLERLLRAQDRTVEAIGFDPSWRGEGGTGPGGARLYRRIFDAHAATTLGLDPDLVVTRHTIEHIADPVAFLAAIRAAMPVRARLCIETPSSRWILDNRAIHDFFYEHCSLFDTGSIARALTRSGFTPTYVEEVFGGQYLWAEAVPRTTTAPFDATSFREGWQRTLERAREAGPVAVWGANAKGSTFLLMVDPRPRTVDCVIDINPMKHGHFIPLTGHGIVSPEAAARRSVGTVVVMNPNYVGEIRAMTREMGWTPAILVLEQEAAP